MPTQKLLIIILCAALYACIPSPLLGQTPMPPKREEGKTLTRLLAKEWRTDAPLHHQVTHIQTVTRRGRTIHCYEVTYTSHPWQGKPVRIFGFYALPETSQKLPGLLMVHGAGGYATLDRVIEAAQHDFACLAIDLPGKGTGREGKSRSTGPDMTVKQIFTVKPGPEHSYIAHAVAAELRGITFLNRQREIDAKRIGMIGVSWGGATGLISTALDSRIRCFVNLYGGGFLNQGSTWLNHLAKMPKPALELWEREFDASQWAPRIKVPVLAVTGTNDGCFWLPQFAQTMRLPKSKVQYIYRPNLNHKVDGSARRGYFRWLEAQLQRSSATSIPGIASLIVRPAQGGYQVAVQSIGAVSVDRVDLTWDTASPVGFARRHWKTVSAHPSQKGPNWMGNIKAPFPQTYLFATATFSDGSMISTPIHTVSTLNFNGRRLAADVPSMSPFRVRSSVRQLALLTGLKSYAHMEDGTVTLYGKGKRVNLAANRYEGSVYVDVRATATALGWEVSKHGMEISILTPPHTMAAHTGKRKVVK